MVIKSSKFTIPDKKTWNMVLNLQGSNLPVSIFSYEKTKPLQTRAAGDYFIFFVLYHPLTFYSLRSQGTRFTRYLGLGFCLHSGLDKLQQVSRAILSLAV